MVEHNLAKVGAAGSIPVSRSIFFAKGQNMKNIVIKSSLACGITLIMAGCASPFPAGSLFTGVNTPVSAGGGGK